MADFKLNQTGAAIQEAIDRAIIAAVTRELSTAEYDALADKDTKTLYIITDDTTEEDLEARVGDLESQMGDVSSLLDTINGEVV